MFLKTCARYCDKHTGIMLLRIAVGVVFVFAGWNKFSNMEMTIGFFGTLGFAPFWAYLVATVELVGGLFVLLGIYIRYAASLLAIIMIVALVTTSWEQGFGPHLQEFNLLLEAVALASLGAGKYAVMKKDHGCCTPEETTTVVQ